MTDSEGLYRGVQHTLVGGMSLSFGLMGLGLLVLLVKQPNDPNAVVALPELPSALLSFDPIALLAAGVLVLMFIPAVLLIVMLIFFWRTNDKRYVGLAGFILLLLGLTVVLAF